MAALNQDMKVEICRVCLGTSDAMVNIFDEKPRRCISIADMISQCTGFCVSKGDSFPETICLRCSQDAQNAFEVKQLYESSHRLFCRAVEHLQSKEDLLKEEICQISDYESENCNYKGRRSKRVHCKTKEEGLIKKCEFERGDSYVQVKNEPIEDEKDHRQISDAFDQIEIKVNSVECEENFRKDDKTNENITKNKKKKPPNGLQCSYCQKTLSSKRNLQVHIRIHTGERPYQCAICSRTFVQVVNMKAHMLTHTGERPYKCSQCEKDFTRRGLLRAHIRTHEEDRSYKCSFCNESFTQSQTFQDHIARHTGERPYECSHCKMTFKLRRTLLVHLRTHTGERPYKCSHCTKSFKHRGSLRVHNRMHTGERPYKCSLCSKSFAQSLHLKVHIFTHTGERPYKCSHCKMAFRVKETLQVHIRSHTGEQPFKCSHCEKAFRHRTSLRNHARKHTRLT